MSRFSTHPKFGLFFFSDANDGYRVAWETVGMMRTHLFEAKKLTGEFSFPLVTTSVVPSGKNT